MSRALPAPPIRAKMNPLLKILALVLIGGLGALLKATSLVLIVGMLPTLAAAIFDRDPRKSAALTVGLMNLGGVVPYVLELWRHGQTLAAAMTIVETPLTLMLMYAVAGIGWLLHYSIPAVVQVVMAQRARLVIAHLETQQAALVKDWGEEIRNNHS